MKPINQKKVAVMLTDGEFFFFGKNLHPALKRRNHSFADIEQQGNPFFLNYPAGVVDECETNMIDAALRELSEETAGFFFTSKKAHDFFSSGVWVEADAIIVEPQDLVLLNDDEVIVEYFDPWKKAHMRISFYFYFLRVRPFSIESLNKFCSVAIENFFGQSEYRCFMEVSAYEKIPVYEFLARLNAFEGFFGESDEWFFSKEDDARLIFSGASFNKGYFVATKKMLENGVSLKRIISLISS